MKKMTTTERRRLRKLEKFLLTVNQERFDMKSFMSRIGGHPRYAKKTLSGCGTAACSMGWSAYLFPRLSAEAYSFEWLADNLFGISLCTGDWNFLFAASWARSDNSPEFAARRIHLYLEKGLPSRWHFSTPESEWRWS